MTIKEKINQLEAIDDALTFIKDRKTWYMVDDEVMGDKTAPSKEDEYSYNRFKVWDAIEKHLVKMADNL